MSNALYLLGFSPMLVARECGCSSEHEFYDPETLSLAELFGIERLEAGPVFAWFKRVDRSDFEGAVGERNLADINWLTPRVMAHEHAIGHLNNQSSFYPARFGTLFSTEQSLYSFTVSATPTLIDFFRMIKGKQEWGLKLYGNYAHAAQRKAQESGIVKQGVPLKGASYLKLKQMKRELSQSGSDAFVTALDMAIASIQQAFSTFKKRPVKGVADGDSSEKLLAAFAILEEFENADAVASWAEQWNRDSAIDSGIRVEITGPWPAYSFCLPLNSVEPLSACAQTVLERGAA